MPAKWCSVSHRDVNGIGHSVTLKAESLYEAAALALAAFRSNDLIINDPVLGTELTISVSPDIQSSHKVTVRQLLKWAESSVEDGLALITKRKKIRSILGLADDFSFEQYQREITQRK